MKRKEFTEIDLRHMRRALELAERGRGGVSPNPMVGAVIVKRGRVIGEGFHERLGGPHAEVNALRNLKESAKGATMYVTLEPCSHFGRTPPCAPQLIEAGVARVVIGMKDPNPLVAGRGLRLLKKNGVETTAGVLEAECRLLNEAFIKFITTGTPFVILKSACSLDGRTAAPCGDSKWITSKASRLDAHGIRAASDAILVGIGTALIDNPRLTCRAPGAKRVPWRVVLDSRLRIPADGNLVKLAEKDNRTIVAAVAPAPARKKKLLEKLGCVVLELPPDENGRVSIPALLRSLHALEVATLMVEGGSETHAAFIEAGAVDKFVIYFAPKIIGGNGAPGVIGGAGVTKAAEALKLRIDNIAGIGPDLRVVARPFAAAAETRKSAGKSNPDARRRRI